jgi:hypothetical protein
MRYLRSGERACLHAARRIANIRSPGIRERIVNVEWIAVDPVGMGSIGVKLIPV